MKGDASVIELLNEVLTSELTAINQYYIHYKMLENWGYKKLAARARAESMEEMQHADKMIERILYLDGIPNMQRLDPVCVGETVTEQHKVELSLELAACERLNRGIALCRDKSDNGTRAMLEATLADEEEAVDWLEARLEMIDKLGEAAYLAEHIHE